MFSWLVNFTKGCLPKGKTIKESNQTKCQNERSFSLKQESSFFVAEQMTPRRQNVKTSKHTQRKQWILSPTFLKGGITTRAQTM